MKPVFLRIFLDMLTYTKIHFNEVGGTLDMSFVTLAAVTASLVRKELSTFSTMFNASRDMEFLFNTMPRDSVIIFTSHNTYYYTLKYNFKII